MVLRFLGSGLEWTALNGRKGVMKQTIAGYALERLLVELQPVKVEAMKPWGVPPFNECFGVFMGILLLHLSEAGDGQVREVLMVCLDVWLVCHFDCLV